MKRNNDKSLTPDEVEVKPRGFNSKRNIVIIALAGDLALGGGITAIAIGTSNSTSHSEASGLQLAERYLSELKYEQAIIEFERVLEIEPMNVDAYLGLADAYLGLGDTDKAIETLRKGLEITGDGRIQKHLDEILNPPVSSSSTSLSRSTSSSSRTHVESEPEIVDTGTVTILGEEYDIATTTELNLSGQNVTNEDLRQIGKLTNLTVLSLWGNQISDITPLARLTNLTYLYLWDNQISDISPLAGLTNLTYLKLGNNQISDITPLAGLTNLSTLYLNDNQISDIALLAGLTNLTWLGLQENQISDISPLAGLTKLEGLYLYTNQISDSDIDWLKEKLPKCGMSV